MKRLRLRRFPKNWDFTFIRPTEKRLGHHNACLTEKRLGLRNARPIKKSLLFLTQNL